MESVGHWRSNLWAAKKGIYYSNVYGKISFAPLNILASVLVMDFNFYVYRSVNYIGSLAKFIYFARDAMFFYTLINLRKMKFIP